MAPGHTPLSWTDYKLEDDHDESEIEDAIARRFEDIAKEWWTKLSEKDKAEFVKGINALMEGTDDVRDVLNSGAAGHARKTLLQRRLDRQAPPVLRMPQLDPGAGQQQASAAEALLEEAVVHALAPGGVADDGVGDVLQVAAQLVLAAALRPQLSSA
jgi:hypothetical protein